MIFLTGATGFVGGTVFSQLMQQSDLPIRVFGRRYTSSLDRPRVSLCLGDINHETDYTLSLCDVDVVIHCAALAHVSGTNYYDYANVNTLSVIHLAEQAVQTGVKRFVFVSSIGVNGTSTDSEHFSLNSTPNPHNAYAQSKYDAEIGLKKIADETGLEVVIVRPTLVYGPNAPGNFGLLTKLVKRLPLLPFGLATNKRDFIAVQNLADLLITCATHPNAAGHTFLASDMETVSIKQFTNAIANGLGKKVLQLPIPVSLMRLAGKLIGKSAMVEQLVGNLQVDSSNLKEVLGWTPPYTMQQAMATLRDSGKSSSGKD